MSANVVFIKGSLAGLRFQLPDAGAIVGRSHSCGIRASEADVSGRHVQIVPAGNGAELTVLSAHRAFVNGRRVPSGARAALRSGDHVRLGESLEFAFMADDAASDAAGDSTSLFPETGAAAGGTLATRGTRATMATMATRATDMAADDASTSDALGPAAGGPRPPRDGAAPGDTTATFPTGSTHLPGDADGDGGETQMLQTQAVSREELELLGRMYERRRQRKTMVKLGLFGLALLIAMLVYVSILSDKPETWLTIPRGKDARRELTLDNRGRDGGRVMLSYPNAPKCSASWSWDKDTCATNLTVDSKVGADWDVPLLIVFSYYDDESALTNSCEASFRAWVNRTFQGSEFVSQSQEPLNDHAFIGDAGGMFQGIRCLSWEYSRFSKGDKFFGVASFFRNGRRCYVFRREVPDGEKVRAGRLLANPRVFLWLDRDGRFSESHWEGLPPADDTAAALSAGDAVRHCEDLLKKESPGDWPQIERDLYRVLAVADRAGDAETQRAALKVLRDLRKQKQIKWKELLSQRKQASNSADKARAHEIDSRARAVFCSEDDARHYRVIKKRWWE